MAIYPNKLDPRTLITIDDAVLQEIPVQFGRFDNSGLFSKDGITTQDYGFQYSALTNDKMTGATSRLERDAWKVSQEKKKRVTLSGTSFKITDAVQYEDLAFRVNDWQSLDPVAREMTVAEAVAEKLPAMMRAMQQNKEYAALTALQGVMKDPEDGSTLVDMLAVTGSARLTHTIDLTASTGVIAAITELVNKVQAAQVYGSGFTGIEVVVADDVFAKLANHPELVAFYEAALSGTGQAYINSPWLNGRVNEKNRSIYGFVQTLVVNGVTFTTYSQKFKRWNGSSVDAVASGKGFTVLQGATGLYQAKFSPAPYISMLGSRGQEMYVWQTPVKDDTHFEIYAETHPMYFMQQPELSVDITFTIA